MSDLGDLFKALKEDSKAKKLDNVKASMALLVDAGIEYQVLSHNGPHLRVGKYDFWPSTGVWIDRESRRKYRGVSNLIRRTQTDLAKEFVSGSGGRIHDYYMQKIRHLESLLEEAQDDKT